MTTPSESDPGGAGHDLNLLAAYVEGRLEAAEQVQMTAHLATCSDCRAILAELARGDAEPQAAKPIEPPRWPVPRWLPLAAVLVAGTIVGVKTLQTRPVPIPPDGANSPTPASTSAPAPEASPNPPVATDGPAASAAPAMPAPSTPGLAPAPSTPVAASPDAEQVLVKRGGVRRVVEGKAFNYVGGEWVDLVFDPGAGLPVVDARSPAERKALLQQLPALAPFAELGPRVVVVRDGVVYRFRTPASP